MRGTVVAGIRPATRDDLPTVVAIERVAFSDAWTRGMFMSHLRESSLDVFLVACDSCGSVVGYAIARTLDDEAELFNIAVDVASRGGGVGAGLLDAVTQACSARGATRMWLEVRASNVAALKLYSRRGFADVGRRRGYYHSPREDALLLRADIAPEPGRGITLAASPLRREVVPRAGTGLLGESGDPILSSARQPTRQETI